MHFDQAAEIFNKYPLKFVNCVNSIGNGLYIEDESVVILSQNGLGGIGGQYIKPTFPEIMSMFLPTPETRNPNHRNWWCPGLGQGCLESISSLWCQYGAVVGTTLHKEGVVASSASPQKSRPVMEEKAMKVQEDFRGN